MTARTYDQETFLKYIKIDVGSLQCDPNRDNGILKLSEEISNEKTVKRETHAGTCKPKASSSLLDSVSLGSSSSGSPT